MGHYYEKTETGVQPMHFVPLVSRPDELRPTRITDVRKWWKEGRIVHPSVTTVQGVLNKPALESWKIDRHLDQAWVTDPDKWNLEDYRTEVKRLTEIEMDRAPRAGTDIHNALELFSGGELPGDDPNYALCEKVIDKVVEITGHKDWIIERRFVDDEYGYGGQVDLYRENWVIDFKSKQTADKFKPGKMCYDDQKIQLAAYRQALAPRASCANVFICLEDGQIDFHELTDDDLIRGWDMFYHALELWKIQNGAPNVAN